MSFASRRRHRAPVAAALVLALCGCDRLDPLAVETHAEPLLSDTQRLPTLLWFESVGEDGAELRVGKPGSEARTLLREATAPGQLPRGAVAADGSLWWTVLPEGRRHGDVARLRTTRYARGDTALAEARDVADALLWPQRPAVQGVSVFVLEGDPTPDSAHEPTGTQQEIDLRLMQVQPPVQTPLWQGEVLWAQAHALPSSWSQSAPLLLVIEPDGNTLLVPGTTWSHSLGAGLVRDVEVDRRPGLVRVLRQSAGEGFASWVEVDVRSSSPPRLIASSLTLDSSPRTDALGRLRVTRTEGGSTRVPEAILAGECLFRVQGASGVFWELGVPPQRVGNGGAISALGVEP